MSCEIIDDFPFAIREVEHETLQLSDGVKLAARYWIPVDAESNPVPAILEYIPYCKRDGTAARDEAIHPYFAGHGYAAIRVDIRGSGESEGVLLDEYLKLEQDDAIEVIAWIADQPWCNGRVGMMGKSWSGFNALQVAARRPDALKCIITVFFTDDRFADDVHYIGGCLALENPMWAFAMFPALCRPPDPLLVGEIWREMWMQRLETCRPWIIEWMQHQRRDAYWKHGSVCENFGDIQVPVYAIGGWADPYSNPVPRVLEGLDVPRKGLIGPWGHYYMHDVVPGPQMGFMDEALRWWDQWLKQKDTGIMEEPQYRVWVQDSVRPHASHQVRPGYWAAEPGWPSSNIDNQTYYLGREGLTLEPESEYMVSINSPQTTGQCMPFLGNMGDGAPQDPVDQRPDDAMSVCFDGPLLEQELSILGAPQATLNLASDQPSTFLCVRLNELLENGESLQVTYGLLNLTHRNSHEWIEDLVAGKQYQVTINLNDIAHTFAAGSRIRLAISNACWPLVWPSPKATKISLFAEQSVFTLPVRAPRDDDALLKDLPPPRKSRAHPQSIVKEAEPVVAEFTTDWNSGIQAFTFATDTGTVRFEKHDWTFSVKSESRYSIHPDDPNTAIMESLATETYGREGQLDIRIEARQAISSDENCFYINAEVEAYENDVKVFSRQWDEKIDRDGV